MLSAGSDDLATMNGKTQWIDLLELSEMAVGQLIGAA